MDINKLARDTAKGMWPGKGSVGQNTSIIKETLEAALEKDRKEREGKEKKIRRCEAGAKSPSMN